jgi:uncharacterized protein
MDQKEFLYRIKSGINSKDPLAEIYLFGSRARGDNHPDSDWDILVLTQQKKVTFDFESDLRDPIFDLELESGQNISLLVYSQSDWENKMFYSTLYTSIQREGIKI